MPTRNSWSQSHLESTTQPDTAYKSQTAASEGEERDLGRERRGQGSQERASRASGARAAAGCFLSGQRTPPGRARPHAQGRVGRPGGLGIPMRTGRKKVRPFRIKFTALLPFILREARRMNLYSASDWLYSNSYTRATARRRGSRRRHPPGRWLAKSCVANDTSVSKAAWLGQPSPTPSARARRWPRARSPSARADVAPRTGSHPCCGRGLAS